MDSVFKGLYAGVFMFLACIAVISFLQDEDPKVLWAMGTVIGFLMFVLISGVLKVKIVIEASFLRIYYFFKVYETDILQITKIRKGETMWSGFHKYGTGTKGLIIFSKFKNDLYITPENEDFFYHKILEINPDVVIEKIEK
ncbi:PH domain-containing protein [Chryseobacterium sp.]|uniref:PH domain-containing protein n=1 Tax=Chryseobacterium sp. TaxID=1871047 RepID=UPI001E3AD2EC|nr:PH domain-containing protein [Chryseobacterium sp.]